MDTGLTVLRYVNIAPMKLIERLLNRSSALQLMDVSSHNDYMIEGVLDTIELSDPEYLIQFWSDDRDGMVLRVDSPDGSHAFITLGVGGSCLVAMPTEDLDLHSEAIGVTIQLQESDVEDIYLFHVKHRVDVNPLQPLLSGTQAVVSFWCENSAEALETFKVWASETFKDLISEFPSGDGAELLYDGVWCDDPRGATAKPSMISQESRKVPRT